MLAGGDVVGHGELRAYLAAVVCAKRKRVQHALESNLSGLIARHVRRGHDYGFAEGGDLRRYVERRRQRRLENKDAAGEQQEDQESRTDSEQGSAPPPFVLRLGQGRKDGGIGRCRRLWFRLRGGRRSAVIDDSGSRKNRRIGGWCGGDGDRR